MYRKQCVVHNPVFGYRHRCWCHQWRKRCQRVHFFRKFSFVVRVSSFRFHFTHATRRIYFLDYFAAKQFDMSLVNNNLAEFYAKWLTVKTNFWKFEEEKRGLNRKAILKWVSPSLFFVFLKRPFLFNSWMEFGELAILNQNRWCGKQMLKRKI